MREEKYVEFENKVVALAKQAVVNNQNLTVGPRDNLKDLQELFDSVSNTVAKNSLEGINGWVFSSLAQVTLLTYMDALDISEEDREEAAVNIAKEVADTYERKNKDYGDSFSNSLDKYGIIASVVRLHDKYSRVESLHSGAKQLVLDEKMTDTLLDAFNYCMMTVVWLEGK